MREFDLLARVMEGNPRLPAAVRVPPGDDMAAIEVAEPVSTLQLRSTISLDAPLQSDAESWRAFGARSIERALSTGSNSAMACVVGATLSQGLSDSAALAFHTGLRQASERGNAPIIGGDLSIMARTVVCVGTLVSSASSRSALAIGTPQSLALVACDSAIEGKHVPRGCDAFVLGRKAMLRNFSDVAAMGNALPVATSAGIVFPLGTTPERLQRLEQGLRETASRWGAPLLNIAWLSDAASDQETGLYACVTILARKLDEARPLALRSDARAGDGVYVTGIIGGAWDPVSGLGRHLDFTPRLAVAQALVRELGDGLGAMIDVSDGLGRDLGHIAELSRVQVRLQLADLPLAEGTVARIAIAQGEDYELAFTARGSVPDSIAGVPITRIGVIETGSPSVLIQEDGEWLDASKLGFEHDGGAS